MTMMDGKEKLYFLVDAINDARVLAPSGQPLIVDPTNNLNHRITVDFYEKKRQEYREKQKDIETKTARLRLTDEQYYVAAEYLLKLASVASKVFESSEMHEKRQLLKLTLQNLTLKGKKVCYNWIKPFDTIANYANRSAWLPLHLLTRTMINHVLY